MYRIFTNNGYIISIVHDVNGNVTEEEYQNIRAALDNRPTPPDGYDYRLTESLEWELYELPPVVDDLEE